MTVYLVSSLPTIPCIHRVGLWFYGSGQPYKSPLCHLPLLRSYVQLMQEGEQQAKTTAWLQKQNSGSARETPSSSVPKDLEQSMCCVCMCMCVCMCVCVCDLWLTVGTRTVRVACVWCGMAGACIYV